ncbi:uncharacterized protein [Clytia hemisphaerica]|uniref:Uncharacterized protein n=2 Tax=Clytia hemisphaerica TaxID=252671 RepID=A0A7M5VG72_9CNID
MENISEMENFLLDCYITSVIKVAMKQVERSQKESNKKVHFGSQIKILMHEYTNYLPEQFDDTLPIEEGVVDYFLDDLNMDSLSSQEEIFDIHKDLWSEKRGSHGYEDMEELPSEEEEEETNLNNDVDTYEDFIKGAHKRRPAESIDCLTSSPDKKKLRIEDGVDLQNDLPTSTPDEDCPKIQDTLMYLKYHVLSYAMDVHKKSLGTNGEKFPHSESENAKLFWNMCSNEREKPHEPQNNVSEGLTLAQQILQQQDSSEEKSIKISNSESRNDFENESSYRRFLRKNSEQLNIQAQNNLIMEQPSRKYNVDQNEIQSYLLPELKEDSPEEVDLVFSGITDLLPENISTSFSQHLQQTAEPTLSPLASLNNTTIDDGEEEKRKQETRFRKAVSLTQEDSQVDDPMERHHVRGYTDLVEGRSHDHGHPEIVEGYKKEQTDLMEGYRSDHTDLIEGRSDDDDHTVPDSMLDFINASDDQIGHDFNQFQFTQTQTMDKEETPKKLNENGEERYSVNHMISELMASQACWGSQYQRSDEDEHDKSEDGVVPGLSRDENHAQRSNSAEEQRHQYQSLTPAFRYHAKARSPFHCNDAGDAVVPGSSSTERLPHIHFSPITTPQKLRLGLSKKMKVKRNLHLYNKD